MANSYNFICFDLETGGLSEKKNPITEIAMIVYGVEDFQEKFRFESFVKPYDDLVLEPEALKSTGITLEMVNSDDAITKRELFEILKDIFSTFMCGNKRFPLPPILVGHNIAKFDIPFLQVIFDAYGEDLFDYVDRYCEDTLKMCRTKWFGKTNKFNLTACCNMAGVEITDAHRALNDVIANKSLHEFLIASSRQDGNFTGSNNNQQNSFRKSFQF